jgi:hypothetical protein
MRRFVFVFTAVVVLVAFTIATADEFTGTVTKFEDGKITVKKGFGKKAEEKTYTVAANAKFNKGKKGAEKGKVDADGALEGGKDAFAKMVKEAVEKKDTTKKFGGGGLFTYIITEGEGDKAQVVEIRVLPGKKKDGGN